MIDENEVEEIEQEEEEISPIEDMLANIVDKDYTEAGKSFDAIMNDKIGDAMEQEEIAMANSVYNGIDPDENIPDDVFDDNEEGDAVELDDEDVAFLDSLEDESEDDDIS